MTGLTQADTLALWERGEAFHPIDQGLLAVETVSSEAHAESVADWPLGRRNRALLELYCASFGRALSGWTACRQCGEKLEFNVDGNALLEGCAADAASPVEIGGRLYRLPTSRDLAQVVGMADPEAAAGRLLQLCVVGGAETVAASNQSDVEAIGERLALADPLAEILLDFYCPQCGATFQEAIDLAVFFWAELEGRVKRLLLDVHELAMAYGWSEADVLNLSPARRNFYLEQVQG